VAATPSFAALEVDDAVGPLVPAAAEADGDAAVVVAAARRRLALRQRLDRLALVELAAVDEDELAQAGVIGLKVLSAMVRSCPLRPVVTSIDVALGEGHDRLLDVRLLARRALETLHLALADERVDALDLDVEQLLDRRLDLRLGRVLADLEDDLVVLGSASSPSR
jgi:hypothetical protein